MVLEIGISNFFSIKDEVVLDLRAGNIKSERARSLSNNVFKFDDIEVLKTVGIYGANASGKSNILKTINLVHTYIFTSHNHNENTIFNLRPFKFGSSSKKPSKYFIRFVVDNIEYIYTVLLNREGYLYESLYHYPKGKKAKIFVRDESESLSKREKYSFGSSVIKRPFDVVESTSSKTSFISRASQMDRDIPKKVFTFFYQKFILRHSNYSEGNLKRLVEAYRPHLLMALRFSDSDIVDFKITWKKEKGKSLKANLQTMEAVFQDEEVEHYEIKTYHRSDPRVPFDLIQEESSGTRKLFFMMLTLIDIIRNNKVLIVDEIEDSLHLKIVNYIIDMFNAGHTAQLIFTTHNTNLLDLTKFRKDQIWFVNKSKEGATDLYSLYDYSDFRDTMDLEKAYLQGRFDSVPIVDDSSDNLNAIVS